MVDQIMTLLQDMSISDMLEFQRRMALSNDQLIDMMRKASGHVDADSAPFWWIEDIECDKKIQAIKALREPSGLPLKEAKMTIEGAIPLKVSGWSFNKKNALRKDLESIGCRITGAESDLPF
jgi:ribosomal protein L7/L12